MRSIVAHLTPTSGRQDHTTSPSAKTTFVSASPPRPSHPAPTSVTIAIRPSCGTGCAKDGGDLGIGQSEIFFAAGLDDPNQIERVGKIRFSERPHEREISNLWRRGSRAHVVLPRNGLTMLRLPYVRPCCISSLKRVSQPASIAAATINAS